MSKPTIIFRANGGTQIGLGHLVRCSALSSILKNDFETILVVRTDLSNISEITKEFSKVEQIDSFSQEQEINFLLGSQEVLLVLDGYDFDFSYQQKLKSKASQLVCIDDIHQHPFLAAVIINHSGGVTPSDYTTTPWCQLYLGPAYALLRKPFLKRNNEIKNKNLFICLGGSDPGNHTLHVLTEAIGLKKYQTIHVVVGNGYQHTQQLHESTGKTQNVKVYKGISANEMANLMQSCAYAVCSPSSVAYEYLAVGSVLFLIQTADNQADLYNYLISSKLAFDWKKDSGVNDLQLEETLNRKLNIFDGKQSERLLTCFLSLHAQQYIVVRKVQPTDMKLCYDWANDPQVRQNSYTKDPIPWETHVAWFNTRLSDQHCYFYILEHKGVPMAQIRFQVNEKIAVLNYLVDAQYRGKSLGSTVVSSGIKKFIEDFNNPVTIHAHVKFSNPASQRAFEKMKFEKQISTDQQESFTYSMVCHGSTSWK